MFIDAHGGFKLTKYWKGIVPAGPLPHILTKDEEVPAVWAKKWGKRDEIQIAGGTSNKWLVLVPLHWVIVSRLKHSPLNTCCSLVWNPFRNSHHSRKVSHERKDCSSWCSQKNEVQFWALKVADARSLYFYLILKISLDIPDRYERVRIHYNEREIGVDPTRCNFRLIVWVWKAAKETNMSPLKIYGAFYWVDWDDTKLVNMWELETTLE